MNIYYLLSQSYASPLSCALMCSPRPTLMPVFIRHARAPWDHTAAPCCACTTPQSACRPVRAGESACCPSRRRSSTSPRGRESRRASQRSMAHCGGAGARAGARASARASARPNVRASARASAKRRCSQHGGTGGRCSRSVLQQLAASTRVVVLSHALLGRGKLSRAYCVGGHDHPSDMPPGMSVVHALRVCSIFSLYTGS